MAEVVSGTESPQKKKKNRKKFRINKTMVKAIIYLLVLMMVIGVVYVYPKVSDASADTMTVEYGNLKKSETLDVYIVKDESVYYAYTDGTVGYNFEEGTMVRRGSSIVVLNSGSAEPTEEMKIFNRRINGLSSKDPFLADVNDNVGAVSSAISDKINSYVRSNIDATMLYYYMSKLDNVTSEAPGYHISDDDGVPKETRGFSGIISQASGVVSYQLDGLESEINPSTMELLDEGSMRAIDGQSVNICAGKAVKGEPLFKIVDNRDWYAVAWIDESDLGKYKEGAAIKLELSDSQYVEGKVYKLVDQGERVMLIMNFSTYFHELGAMRKVTADVVTSDESGLIIKNSFIKSVDGQIGVYVNDIEGGEPKFTPVSVIDTDGELSLIKAGTFEQKDEDGNTREVQTVEVYDELIKVD